MLVIVKLSAACQKNSKVGQSLDAAAARFTNVQKLPAEEGGGEEVEAEQ